MTGRQLLYAVVIGGIATMLVQAVWAFAWAAWTERRQAVR